MSFDMMIIALLLLVSTASRASCSIDDLPFGHERLSDFFFVQNGTTFHQFVRETVLVEVRMLTEWVI